MREKVSYDENICLTQKIEKQTNCHSDASFCYKIAFGIKLFAKKIKSDAK